MQTPVQDYVDRKESGKYDTMIPPKETNKIPVTNSKEMEIYDLHDNDLKIIILKKLNEMQENTDRQQNEIRKATHEQMRSLVKEKRNHKKTNQTNRNPGAEEYNGKMEKVKDRFNNRLDHIVESANSEII